MVFSSVIFLLYFLPAFLLAYYLSPPAWKNFVALLGSCLFYAWGEPTFFFLILLSLVIDYYLVLLMQHAEGKLKKNLLALVVGLNVLNLLVHKYLMFVVYNLGQLSTAVGLGELPPVWIALPIGISFITFQKISYAVDVYRRVRPPMEGFANYALYILFFPQLIAGPIIRFHEVADQIRDRSSQETIDNKLLGFQRFVVGLSKKVLIANPLGMFVDEVFAALPHGMDTGTAWLGMLAYSFQIYFDFSGYSDMAIGLARMMGFYFPENFRFPYIAESITEFWRRWHITLSKWMRDYLYIPLGGNRVKVARLYVNLWVVFLISGLWHGAAWTFVIWGAFHGLFLVLERIGLQGITRRWPRVLRIGLTYFIVLIGWVFFRAESLPAAGSMLGMMAGIGTAPGLVQADAYQLFILLLAAIFSFMGVFPALEARAEKVFATIKPVSVYSWQTAAVLFLGLLCVAELYAGGFNPFIYFRF